MKKIKSSHRVLEYAVTCVVVSIFFFTAGLVSPAYSQAISSVDRERAEVMLDQIKNDIKKNYYDPTFHGLDIEARFKAADTMLDKATSLGQAFGIIAQAVLGLNDSHTFFIPPAQNVVSEYGWQIQALGEQCYVVAVKPGSDAEAKGLKAGDLILSVNGIPVKREELWKFRYLYYGLRPQPGMRLVIQTPDGQERRLDVLAKVRTEKIRLDFTGMQGGADIWNVIRDLERENQLRRHRHYEMGDELFVWKMPQFDLSPEKVDNMADRIKGKKALLLDLRGNSGGGETTLLHLISSLFEKDVSVATLKRRNESKPLLAKGSDQKSFKGKLVVLVDSDSGSAAEILARVMQLEKRGTVIGDRSAGAVMRSKFLPHQMGIDIAVFYGVSVTDADVIMADGKSLEHTGVVPDLLMLPTAKDLASKRDPILSHAASLLGVTIDPEKAGTLFPREWR